MLEAIRQTGGLKRKGDTCATGRPVVIPKSLEKCGMIFNFRAQNHADPRKPKGLRLPQIERIGEKLLFIKWGWWMCKLDLSNCFWSITLPALWRHSFKVFMLWGGGGLRWTRLPFWSAYSPVVCQKLVSGIVHGALSKLESDGFVYLDDVLLVARCRRMGGDAFLVARKLRKEGFLTSPKSAMEPTQRIDFTGKWFASAASSISNRQGLIVGIIGLCFTPLMRDSCPDCWGGWSGCCVPTQESWPF